MKTMWLQEKKESKFFKLFFPVLNFKGGEREKNVFIFETTKFSI